MDLAEEVEAKFADENDQSMRYENMFFNALLYCLSRVARVLAGAFGGRTVESDNLLHCLRLVPCRRVTKSWL